MNIVVTGAAGFIGSHTVDQLLAAGHRVLGVDNFRTGRQENLGAALGHRTFSLREFDVTDDTRLTALFREVRPDAVIHLAALVSVVESIAHPELNRRLNYEATCIVARAARDTQVRRLVFASSAAVYGDPAAVPVAEDALAAPLSPYGRAKLDSERFLLGLAAECGAVVRCQRYFNVYGPRQDPGSPYSGVISIFLGCLRRNAPPTIFGDGGQTRDFISVLDVARANLLAATKPGLASGTANICTGHATSINELWHRLAQCQPGAPRPRYAPSRPGDIRHSCGSPAAAVAALDFRAEITVADGLAALADSAAGPPPGRSP